MPHTLEAVSGGNLRIVNEVLGFRYTVAAASLAFVRRLIASVTVTAGPFGSGSNVVVHVPNAVAYTAGDFVEVREGSAKDYTSVVSVNVGAGTITLKTLANVYTVAAKVFQLAVSYDMVVIPDAGETTAVSLYGTTRDQMVVRAVWTALTAAEFARMAALLGVTVSGSTAQKVGQVYDALVAAKKLEPRAVGAGVLDPSLFQRDGGEFVSFSKASFDDQFESASGTATFDEYSFEVPFDCFLQRASVYTNLASALDAYVTITKNDVTPIVASGPIPPNRNLPVVTGQQKGVDLSNIPCQKGDKITVRLNIVGANTIQRCKVSIGYAARLLSLP